MEHVHQRDNNWSPSPIADSATPFSRGDPLLLTPNRRVLDETTPHPQYTDIPRFSNRLSLYPNPASVSCGPPLLKPMFQGFERPSLTRIAILTALCFSAYPALYILTLVARDKSLFAVRLIVATWCSGVGFALGYILIKIGVQHLEAASE